MNKQPRLSILDSFLSLWIFLAMALGVRLRNLIRRATDFIGYFQVDTISIPIGLILIMVKTPSP